MCRRRHRRRRRRRRRRLLLREALGRVHAVLVARAQRPAVPRGRLAQQRQPRPEVAGGAGRLRAATRGEAIFTPPVCLKF